MDALISLLRRVRRRLLVHRRGLAAGAAAGAVLAGLQAAAPPPPTTTAVWTTARELPGGSVLRAEDLRRTEFAPGSVPQGAAAPRDLVGRTLLAPATAGTPLTRASVLAPGMLAAHPGLRAVPVRLADPAVARLVRVGDRVDLVAATADRPGQARLVASDALLLSRPRSVQNAADRGISGALVVVGVTEGEVGNVVTAGISGYLTAVWTR